MKPYELLEHTADAKFRAYGKTLEEAFANAVKGMTAIVVDPATLDKNEKYEITVNANTREKLLFDMLDEILYLLDTEKFMPAVAENLQIKEEKERLHLTATLLGDDARKHPHNLKAVTYSDMIVEEKKGKWMLQAVIDI